MLTSTRHSQPITRLVGLLVLVCACKGNRDASHHDTGAPAPEVRPVAAAPVPADGAAGNTITVTVAKPRVPGNGLAKRCMLGGDPIASDCIGGGAGLAVDREGVVHVVAGDQVRSYQRVAGDECRLDPVGTPIALPPDNPRPQPLGGGPVYMRSGGPAWQLAMVGDTLYAIDFLAGLFRIDHDKLTPVCTDVFGYGSVAALGSRLLIRRNGIEQLAVGRNGHCKGTSARIDDKARGDVRVIGGHVYVSARGGGEIIRYGGATRVTLGEGTRICSVTGLTACGDGVCAIDNNCMQVIQLGADGNVIRTIDDAALFDTRPWSLHTAVTAGDGTVYVFGRHRDKTGGGATCEAAIYALPAAMFAL